MAQSTSRPSAEDPSRQDEQTLAFSSDIPATVGPRASTQPTIGGQPVAELIQDVLSGHESRPSQSPAGLSSLNHDQPHGTQVRTATRALVAVDGDGVQRIGGTLISLDCVVIAYQQGKPPEEIQRAFPALSLEQVYGSIAHYLGHRLEVDQYLQQRQAAPEPWIARQQRDQIARGLNRAADVTALPPNLADLGATADLHSPDISEIVGPEPQAAETVAPSAATSTGNGATTVPPSAARSRATQAGMDAQTVAPSSRSGTSDPMLRQIEMSGKLGPFEIVHKLGQGGMGAVYLARQVSLDRKVAVKVLTSQLSSDASFVARFTREAYAAAQLTHHNIVQIHDIGEENEVHFFSMEFVEGQTLKSLLKSGGRVEPATAVSYILQAARGLKFAHDHCLIHRDIKPENLMLNDQGLVKVADLGLVKRKGISDEKGSLLALASDASMTGAAAAMGTPAYMPPEQAIDAASVDVRADIYSLGCTLYDLLTGHPPFAGRTAVEIMTKHATEAVVPPDKEVADVPKSLSAILLKMMAKKPQDRYGGMDEVVGVLGEYIAISRGGDAGPFVPQAHHLRGLELAVNQFNSASWEYVRRFAIWAYFGVGALGLLATIWGAHLKGLLRALWDMHQKIAVGTMGLMVLTFGCYALLSAFSRRAYLSKQLRQLVSAASAMDWITAGLAAAIVLACLSLLHLQLLGLVCLVIAFLIALAFHCTVDRAIRNERRTSLLQLETILKTMRQQGMDEDELRLFVCEHAGAKWEEIYLGLFGSDTRIPATLRRKLGARGVVRRKWGALGNPIVHAIDARMRQREEERQVQYFARIEERKLLAQGMQPANARTRAQQIANNIVLRARRFKDALDDSKVEQTAQRIGADALLDDDVEVGEIQHENHRDLRRIVRNIVQATMGPQVRLIAGLLMLAVFVLWLKASYPTLPTLIVQNMRQVRDQIQNGQFKMEPKAVRAERAAAPLTTDNSAVRSANEAADQIAHLSDQSRKNIVRTERSVFLALGSWRGGLAGAILVLSSLFRKRSAGPITLGAVVLILLLG